MPRAERVRLDELRVLDGPNLYLTTPAIKLTLGVPGWLELPEDAVVAAAARMRLPGSSEPRRAALRPGAPGTQQRRRFVTRISAHVTRSLAEGVRTHVAVRARAGPEPDQVVVAYPWRRRNLAEALGREVADALRAGLDARRSFGSVVRAAAARLEKVEPGPGPEVPDPTIPVVAVTGTNGKTTTVRLLAHIVRTTGKNVAYSSTDGVYMNEQLVEKGDYSGFGGAARALAQPGVDVAVLETARGGILLRGIGTLHNDVAVVTNVSADHLGLHGIETIDQLAEVKATITRITRPEGWDVLNADDPRVLAMRRLAGGRAWLTSLDPEHPALRTVLSEGGRGMTVIDGAMTLLQPGRDPQPIVALEDVPVTLAGLSSHNISNAMCATAAALGIGLPQRAVVRGLKTFVLDEEKNPGRTNLYEVDGRVVVVDYAHNEAGMQGLVETCQGLRAPGAEVWIAACSAGDRTPQIRHAFAYAAARGSDHFVIAQLLKYLRGNTPEAVIAGLKAGAEEAGQTGVPVFVDEISALRWMLDGSKPRDVVAVTALSQRPEIFALMKERGTRVDFKRVRQLVRRARGRR